VWLSVDEVFVRAALRDTPAATVGVSVPGSAHLGAMWDYFEERENPGEVLGGKVLGRLIYRT